MGMVTVLLFSTILLIAFLTLCIKSPNKGLAGHLQATIFSTVMICLVYIYIIDVFSNKMGAHNVTYDVILNYVLNLKTIAGVFSLSANKIIAVIVGIALVIFIFYQCLSGFILKSFEALLLPDRRYSFFRTKKNIFIFLTFLILFYLVFSLFMGKYFNALYWRTWRGEPLANFLVFWGPFSSDPHRIAIANLDRAMRSEYAGNDSFIKKNIILISLDSLRADHTSAYGYEKPTTPFLKELVDQKGANKIELALATCPESSCGILSTLASKNFISLADYNFKIHDLLKDQGYLVHFITSDDLIKYERVRKYLGNSIDFYFDSNYSVKYGVMDDRIIFEALEKIPPCTGSPAFFFFHLMSTHLLGHK